MYLFFSSQQFGRKFVIIFQKKSKKGVCGVLKLDFFFYHLIVITHLLSWVLPRPENDYAGFFPLACRDRPKPHFPHLAKAEYPTRAIISHGLYIVNPLVEGQFNLYKGLFS